ncbi:recombinase family protein [Chitinophaga polysaccharea]|uniref:recombinase family protein n=1 Tax=Chitinophaga polysaccharea TaxID=1293035 RepID=UPI0011572CAA|nr:recombinase family protein [Chitinophaga polysaccharea]
MSSAFLYVRVSTDEQALRGYSLSFQEKKLQEYCSLYKIQVVDIIREDHSAKTFNRPGWNKLMRSLKERQISFPNFLLFTKWDRFSRNASEAFATIALLKKLGIVTQAIDQPLDLSIPENKILLAVYIATSEVENERRSLNVKQGIHEAREQGRWTSHPPLGYTYIYTSQGEKCLGIKENEATFIETAFILIAANPKRNVQSIYEQLLAQGMQCSRSNFWRILQNPAYCGKVNVPAFEDEPSHFVNGKHTGIVSELLFKQVQQTLKDKRKQTVITESLNPQLILRGFVYCPQCHKRLTGSRSKGRHTYYSYYHCQHCKHFRASADKVNQLFQNEIETLTVGEGYINIFHRILSHFLQQEKEDINRTQLLLSNSIHKLIDRIVKTNRLQLMNEITVEDFQLIKVDCERYIKQLAINFQESKKKGKATNYILKSTLRKLNDPGWFWSTADALNKRQFLHLLIDQEIILSEHPKMTNSLIWQAQMVYGVACQEEFKEPRRFNWVNELESINEELIAEIMFYEQSRCRTINAQKAQYILDFMVNMVLLVLRIT